MSSDSNGLNSSTGLKVVNNMKFLHYLESPRQPCVSITRSYPCPAVPPVNQSMEVYLHFLYSMSRQGNNASHSGESASFGMFSIQELSTGPSYPGV